MNNPKKEEKNECEKCKGRSKRICDDCREMTYSLYNICYKCLDKRYPKSPHQEPVNNDYSHLSHTHCWDNVKYGEKPPCGIFLSQHTQCCLCDIKVPVLEEEKKCEHTGTSKDIVGCDICHQSPHQEPDYKIGYCTHCMQSTNYLKEICQKCKPHQEPVATQHDVECKGCGGVSCKNKVLKGGTGRIMYQRGLEEGLELRKSYTEFNEDEANKMVKAEKERIVKIIKNDNSEAREMLTSGHWLNQEDLINLITNQ